MTEPLILRYRVVDAFADRPFTGNPAAVVLPHGDSVPGNLSDATLQAIAAEMNLSETAFPYPPSAEDAVAPQADGSAGDALPAVQRLRWFTPTTEVTLCGHATLATAHILLEEGYTAPLRFESLSGPLQVEREADGRLRLDFPIDRHRTHPTPSGLMEALGLPGATPFLTGRRCALIPIESEAQLLSLSPDYGALRRASLPLGVMGVSVTAPGESEKVDFVSRFFGPWVGVDEDPVTGMAHCVLGSYWAERLGKTRLEARQRSRRGGKLTVQVEGDRIHLVGRAVTVAKGELMLPAAFARDAALG